MSALVCEMSPTQVAHGRAMQLLERYGVLTRETALGEGIAGGFAGVYPVLKELEERGTIRRGYFVAGLGAAQFALGGAVERIRSVRGEPNRSSCSADGILVMAASDPAQPYGASLRWPHSEGRPSRGAGALVVIGDGELLAFVERGAKTLTVFDAGERDRRWAAGLAEVVRTGRRSSLSISKVNAISARESLHGEVLKEAGFVEGYKGLVMRQR